MDRFSKTAEEFLKSVAHQPWGTNKRGQVRVLVPKEIAKAQKLISRYEEDQVCPICMWGNLREMRWKYTVDYWAIVGQTGLAGRDVLDIIRAADYPDNPHRAHLEELLGMTK